jgi:hypothetical protein
VGALRGILFCRRATRRTVCNTRPGGDEQWPIGSGQRRAQGLYDAPVYLANFLELREIVNEGRVDHTVRQGRPFAQAFEVSKIAAMHLGARGHKRLGAGLRAREAQHLMGPALMSSGTMAEPIKPVAPVTKIRIFFSPSGPFELPVYTPTILTSRH